jgi:benzoate/toluate 1,2-dioxygenase reductase subunit
MHRARLEFQDGEAFDLDVAEGQTVIEAAMLSDAPVRYDCSSGTCGTCIGRLVAGEVEQIPSSPQIVTEAERAAGVYPTCLTRLASDAAFRFDYPLLPQPSAAGRQQARVMEVTRIANGVARLRLELSTPEAFGFQSGQYLRLRPPGIRTARAYSVASIPADLPVIELLIRLLPGGEVSGWLLDKAAPGDTVTIHGPLGGFALDSRAPRQVFIAGGTGVSPILSMIRGVAGTQGSRLLCFGCTRHDELFLLDELAALADQTPGLEVRIAAMEGGAGWIRAGTAVSLLEPIDLEGDAAFHLCGPPPMVDAARELLTSGGVPAEAIRAERFQPRG